MELTQKHRDYWHKNLVVTAILLFIWFVVTFVEAWYARELNGFTFFGCGARNVAATEGAA